MVKIRLNDIVGDINRVESFILFRTIEDWCSDNIQNTNWKFDHAHTICLYGVDVPGVIVFKRKEDKVAFKHRFKLE